jgi:serine/threonine protein kinase
VSESAPNLAHFTGGVATDTQPPDRSEALRLLGLPEGASREDVETAHARLDAELGEKLTLPVPVFIREKLTRQRGALERARDLLVASAAHRDIPSISASEGSANTSCGATTDAPTPLIGSELGGRYELVDFIGAGATGRVYRAFDKLKQSYIAVKLIAPEIVGLKAAQERFVSEVKLACSLTHPNILRVHDVGVDGSTYYITMELLHGQTLRAKMEAQKRQRAPFPADHGLAIARDLLGALAFAHQHLVHLDLKPENIWIGDDGAVKIMDFGMARSLERPRKSGSGQTVGSAYYLAPEQLRGAPLDHRADQYGIAVVLYELLSGRIPAGVVKPLSALRRDIPSRVSKSIMRALNASPEDRYATTDEFRQLLVETGGIHAMPPWALHLLAATAVAVLVAGGVLTAIKHGDSLKRLSPFQWAGDRDAAVRASVTTAQLFGQVDAFGADLHTQVHSLQDKLNRITDTGSSASRDPGAARQKLDAARLELEAAQSLLDLWSTDIYPSTARMDMESTRAVADIDTKEAKYSQALDLYSHIRSYLEPRVRALASLEGISNARRESLFAQSRWTQYARDEQQPEANGQSQRAAELLRTASVAFTSADMERAISAYREATRIYTSLLSAARERVANAARAQADAQQSARLAERAAEERKRTVERESRNEYFRPGRRFNDPLRSGGFGPTMVVSREPILEQRSGQADTPLSVPMSAEAVSAAYIDGEQFEQFRRASGYEPAITRLRTLYREQASPAAEDGTVAKEDAAAYAAWLSTETGFKYSVSDIRRADDLAIRFRVARQL